MSERLHGGDASAEEERELDGALLDADHSADMLLLNSGGSSGVSGLLSSSSPSLSPASSMVVLQGEVVDDDDDDDDEDEVIHHKPPSTSSSSSALSSSYPQQQQQQPPPQPSPPPPPTTSGTPLVSSTSTAPAHVPVDVPVVPPPGLSMSTPLEEPAPAAAVSTRRRKARRRAARPNSFPEELKAVSTRSVGRSMDAVVELGKKATTPPTPPTTTTTKGKKKKMKRSSSRASVSSTKSGVKKVKKKKKSKKLRGSKSGSLSARSIASRSLNVSPTFRRLRGSSSQTYEVVYSDGATVYDEDDDDDTPYDDNDPYRPRDDDYEEEAGGRLHTHLLAAEEVGAGFIPKVSPRKLMARVKQEREQRGEAQVKGKTILTGKVKMKLSLKRAQKMSLSHSNSATNSGSNTARSNTSTASAPPGSLGLHSSNRSGDDGDIDDDFEEDEDEELDEDYNTHGGEADEGVQAPSPHSSRVPSLALGHDSRSWRRRPPPVPVLSTGDGDEMATELIPARGPVFEPSPLRQFGKGRKQQQQQQPPRRRGPLPRELDDVDPVAATASRAPVVPLIAHAEKQHESECLKISQNCNPKSMAGAIAHAARQGECPDLLATGPRSINQCIKSVAIARDYLEGNRIDLTAYAVFRRDKRAGLTLSLTKQVRRASAVSEPESQELRVGKNSSPNHVAGAIANKLRDGQRIACIAIGAQSVMHAVKAIATARRYLEDDQMDIGFRPMFATVEFEDGRDCNAIKLVILAQQV